MTFKLRQRSNFAVLLAFVGMTIGCMNEGSSNNDRLAPRPIRVINSPPKEAPSTSNPGTSQPPRSPSSGSSSATINSWSGDFPAGRLVNDCFDNSSYNLCLVYKDPVTMNRAPFSPRLTAENSNDRISGEFLTYGLKVPESGRLSNSHFSIVSSDPAEPDSRGNWKYAYNRTEASAISQLNAFYWANRLRTYMTERTGKFWLSSKGTQVRTFDRGLVNNAYFNGRELAFGVLRTKEGSGSIALDAAVVAHETGHGNLFYASRQASTRGGDTVCTSGSCRCRSSNGCFGAIHEGVGDVHSFILFPDKGGSMGNYFSNNMNGLRNAENIWNRRNTAKQIFDQKGGSIHHMGSVYAAIWWGVWKSAKDEGREREIETIFTEHLAALSNQDNFKTAYSAIRSLVNRLGGGNASRIAADFQREFERLGINI